MNILTPPGIFARTDLALSVVVVPARWIPLRATNPSHFSIPQCSEFDISRADIFHLLLLLPPAT